ncbi:MAG: hypothetical protein ACT4O5_13835 [Gammaproteobacteria bacterium]
MAYENEQIGGARESGAAGNGSKVREHLKAAGSAAGDAARVRSGQAQEWARAQLSGIQGRLESNPQRGTLWALGVGLVFGIVLSSLLRGRSE